MNEFTGEVVADFVDVRFAISGKINRVLKKNGERVKKSEIIAVLDNKILQLELEKELADYEKTRADFELFLKKYGTDDADDTVKFLRTKQQADVNVAVKNSELAKFRLDETELLSPVNGIIVDTHGLASGLNITSASNPVTIFNVDSLAFVIEVPQEELFQFQETRQMKIMLDGMKEPIIGTQGMPIRGKKGQFSLPITLQPQDFIFPGMTGKATFKLD